MVTAYYGRATMTHVVFNRLFDGHKHRYEPWCRPARLWSTIGYTPGPLPAHSKLAYGYYIISDTVVYGAVASETSEMPSVSGRAG
jgi:hypothetical protein